MWSDFKKFIFRGNVIDLAVGVIIGGAFGKIVTSLVNDIIMPIFGFLTAGIDFKELVWVIVPKVTQGDKVINPGISVAYGNFVQSVIDFIIQALCIFLFIKIFTKVRETAETTAKKLIRDSKGKVSAEEVAPMIPQDIALLTEIRDLLKEQKDGDKKD